MAPETGQPSDAAYNRVHPGLISGPVCALRTRAVRDGDNWRDNGNKTWITHAARIPVMTLLARTDPDTTDCRGLSMLLAEKTPGTGADPCPAPGMTGGKIAVQNYQDM